MVKLKDVVKIVRSKNASPFKLTIDLFFDNKDKYMLVKNSKILTKKKIAKVYCVPEENIEGIFFVDNVLGIKVTIIKKTASDEVYTTDVYGAQQHIPIMELTI
ncbi:MAG: DUF4387 domain-containing protein [Candidatus Bathyarchaeota archaeon]